MAEVSVLAQIKSLVELQKLDKDIYHLKMDLKERPLQLKELEENFESKKAGLKELEEKYKAIQVTRNTYEGDLQAREQAIAKANTDLSAIKTNKEYTAKITEIEGIKADKSIIEEKILHAFDEADAVQKSIEDEKQALAEQEKVYLGEKKDLEDSIKKAQEQIKTLENQRNQLLPGIDKQTLSRYEKILLNKEGLAIVPIQGNSCGGCYMNVPAQVINEIKMHEHLIFCEMCTRILYIEEDVAS